MATMISPTAQSVLLEGVSWATYECLLTDFGDSHTVRVAYDQGALEIMAPSYAHEQLNNLMAMIVSFVATEMDIDFENAGSTTFKRADMGRGFEPDSCFYLQHVAAIRSKRTIDLATDPPPDLVVEVDISHPSLNKFPIYVSLRVPEVWRHDGATLQFFRLSGDWYTLTPESSLFPFLVAEVLAGFVQQGMAYGIIPMIRACRDWVRAHRQ